MQLVACTFSTEKSSEQCSKYLEYVFQVSNAKLEGPVVSTIIPTGCKGLLADVSPFAGTCVCQVVCFMH